MYYEKKELPFTAVKDWGIKFPIHIHQQIEIVHVVRGIIKMQIGEVSYDLKAGDFAFIFPNVLHDYDMLSPKTDIWMQIINCRTELLPWHQKKLLNTVPKIPVLHACEIHKDVLYAEKYLYELSYNEENAPLISSLTSLMLSRAFPKLELIPFQTRTAQDLSGDIIAYISNHYSEDLTLDRVANKFGLGKYALSRIFSNVLRINFVSYINALRINHAEYLLMTTDLNVISITMECGYHNQQTFNRIFKERYGCTPTDYRNEHASDLRFRAANALHTS